MNYNNFISISIGDIDGIGIEIIIRLWKKNKIKNFVVFSNLNIFNNYLQKYKTKLSLNLIDQNTFFNVQKLENKFNIFSFKAKNEIENTMNSLKISYQFTKKYNFKGLLTLPLNKEKIIKNKFKDFTGHTEYLEKIDKVKLSNMIFIKNKIFFSTITTHIRIQKVSSHIRSEDFILNKIKSLFKSLKNDFNIKKPKVLISGLNPHSGENGAIGDEEIRFIKPVVKHLKKINFDIQGPASADSMITKITIKSFHCFLFMYHDQALIPFKYISKNTGINFTSNLSIIRVSPDHGTAYDIVGKNKADVKSILNCFRMINKISKNRKKIEKA